ncbi:MAG: Asp/Glu racemase [Pseudomonadota bacterium]
MTDTIVLEHLPFETDAGISSRARLGLIALASDYTVEHEFQLILRHLPGVALHVARIPNSPHITPESLAAMEAHLTGTAETLLPGDTLDTIAYGCTSASMVIGPERVAELVQAAKPGTPVVNPISSALLTFDALGIQRVGVLTPYTADVNAGIQRFIEAAGYTVPAFASFNEPSDTVVAAITPDSLRSAVHKLADCTPVDGIFVSCTSIRLLEQIESLEDELAMPVTSSNHALIWQTLRQAGVHDPLADFGRLFRSAELGIEVARTPKDLGSNLTAKPASNE